MHVSLSTRQGERDKHQQEMPGVTCAAGFTRIGNRFERVTEYTAVRPSVALLDGWLPGGIVTDGPRL